MRRRLGAVGVLLAGVLLVGGLARADTAQQLVPAEVSLFPTSAAPVHPVENDSQAVELGLRFTADTPGDVTGVRFYKGQGNTGTHVGHLWSAGGQLLATVTVVGESGTGWQTAYFPVRISLTPGATYVVSYLAPKGHYAEDDGGFAQALDNAPLHAPSGAGVYHTGTGFPSSTWHQADYWVDVVFKPAPSAATTTTTSAPTTSTTLAPTTTVPDPTTTVPATTTTVPDTTTTTAVPETTTTTTQPPAFVVRDVTNTGPDGGALHPCAGPVTITVPGTVLDHCDVEGGGVAITADNVTVTNSVIHGDVRIGRSQDNHDTATHGAIVVGNEIIGGGGGGSGIAEVAGFDGTYQRNNLHGWENCATFWTATRAQVLDNWCHGMQGSGSAHFDGFEVYGVDGGITIRGNTIDECCESGDVAPLNITPVPSTVGTIVVDSNLLISGSSSYVVLGDDGQGSTGINAVFTGNHLERFQSGAYWSLRHNHTSSYSGSGNVDALTGAPVPVDG